MAIVLVSVEVFRVKSRLRLIASAVQNNCVLTGGLTKNSFRCLHLVNPDQLHNKQQTPPVLAIGMTEQFKVAVSRTHLGP